MATLIEKLREKAGEEGFASLRIASPHAVPGAALRLREYLAEGRHGDMSWMATTSKRRESVSALWPQTRSVLMLAHNYGQNLDPLARLAAKDKGNISVYALGRDYHDVIKGKLKRIASWFAQEAGAEVKVFVDTAPLMEKPLGEAAGLGWQGKHTNLVSRELGSWFFLACILTDAVLPADKPESDHCGTCRACLDICPTRAFPAPYQLDARRCISYLTIEHKGHIAREFRAAMGNRIYGCDDCLAVCPWNKFAAIARDAKLKARDDLVAPRLAELARLDDPTFRARFSGSPIKRTGRDRFVRNVLIAIGNSSDPSLACEAERSLADSSPLVRAMAVWALSRLASKGELASLRRRHLPQETDAAVQSEWRNT
jgi:epoxyqueuosine reductase